MPLPLRAPPSRSHLQAQQLNSQQQQAQWTHAERQINEVLETIQRDWPNLCEDNCVPVQLALQLLDNSSVGRAHEYRSFQQTHQYLQDSLKAIVHDYHQGFNSSIGTFHKIQGSIMASQKRVRVLKENLANSKTALCTTDPELKKLYNSSQMYDELLQTLNELEDLKQVPDQLEARISEKRFLTAVEVLQSALRRLRKPELDDIGALSELRAYLANQETALMDILIEELHEHLYLKSPYCQERWQNLAKSQGSFRDDITDAGAVVPFFEVLTSMDMDKPVQEDPGRNPESDTFSYVALLVEALNKLGRLEAAVDTIKQRLPVELFSVVNETINEVDHKHPSSLRGISNGSGGLHIYSNRETQMRADVIYDLLWTLYGKFEAIAEGHRLFHESIKALIRREGSGNNATLLGSFKELWNLYQNEIRSLLHNYVTTDADLYQFNTPQPGAANGRLDAHREHLFKFNEADQKSAELVAEFEELDKIIEQAVPGLTAGQIKGGKGDKKGGANNNSSSNNRASEARKGNGFSYGSREQQESYKSLVEPNVFNMSLLLPPTLVFLGRLKNIVPPGSDLATSTLTTFLDNFLVNVFQPQLDETLGKLSDAVFGEADAFQQDAEWSRTARRPVFKGVTDFFAVVTAFCKMLDTIPHDQALSSLIITQMMRYYDRCWGWYKTLVTKTQEGNPTEQALRASAVMATESGEIRNAIQRLWTANRIEDDLLDNEVALLIKEMNEKPLQLGDIIFDKDTISSLCLLYTSMKWLSVKVSGLRHITQNETDSNRSSIPKPGKRRWTLLNDPSKATAEDGPVFLPMTQETVQSFDGVVSSYEELAATSLLTLHMEVRCRVGYSLRVALDPKTAPYLLDQDVKEPDPQIISLNSELVAYDETIVKNLREREVAFIRSGLGLLINSYLVANAPMVAPINSRGSGRMQLNILVLQQNLKNIEAGVDLSRAANYWALFDLGVDGIVAKAKEDAAKAGDAGGNVGRDANRFTYDELKALIELFYSEALASKERGIENNAKRMMADKLLELSEHMWQS
ncbi:Sec8 exocyst complex component-specific domain-domain-containing protein [Coniella lustricola]|uniref:Exocyst complex component Sec8 n=1 Tax=Coniella lustricola TaxID=2025994 RepID=A0A2T3A5P7_9PEZI|nr:Sec8 exocyst complex component-specific domain-domain-containing protein [Coniella lustricola]